MLYRLLLWLYPASFRHEYGTEMARLFAERRRKASSVERAGLWLEAAADALTQAPRIHLDVLRQDLRYTRRTLGRTPGFVVVAILVMALGIGATTSVFSVADRVLLRPLPFASPDRLVRIWENVPGYPQMEPSPANYRDWAAMSGSFEGLGAHTSLSKNMLRNEPERIVSAAVTAEMLPLLGVQPALGRLFLPEETRTGGAGAVILSDRLWRRAFGADPSVIGRPLRLDQESMTIVGVMPAGFYFPDRATELWIPTRWGPSMFEDRDNNFLGVVGRLRPGVTLGAARADMDGVMTALERAHPVENAQSRATVRLISDQVSGQSRMLIRALAGAAACLLLIACTNLASLLLTRFMARRRELTVRAALGAGRERLTRQLVTESLVLSISGGAAGILLATIFTPLLVQLVPTPLPVDDATVLDVRVLVFAAIVTVATGVAFGVLPAWRVCRGAHAASLRETARGTGGAHPERLRGVLVAAQITASILLLASAGLLIRALARVQATDPGFAVAGVLSVRTALPPARYEAALERARFYERVLQEVSALPGVESAAYTSFTPLVVRGGIWPVEMPGIDPNGDDAGVHTASLRFITPAFFDTLGIPIRLGRTVAASDTFESPFVAVVSESFAKRYWPGQDPIGRRFKFAFFDRTIVGVVQDIRARGLESVSEPQVYVPYRQVPDGGVPFYVPKDLLVKTAGDPMALAPSIRRIVKAVDPELPVSDIRTMEEVLELQTASRRTQTTVLALFAAMSMLLAGIGLHGLLSYGVSQRRQEIGVRMALGASRSAVVRLVLADSLRVAVLGSAIGLVLAYAAARWFESLLAGVRPADPLTYALAGALTTLMVLSGSLAPAIRALRVDPITAIRTD